MSKVVAEKFEDEEESDDEYDDEYDDDDVYFEIDCVKDVRVDKNGTEQYLVKWKDCLEETWVPDECLCDTAMAEAAALRAKILRKNKRKLLPLDDDQQQHHQQQQAKKEKKKEAAKKKQLTTASNSSARRSSTCRRRSSSSSRNRHPKPIMSTSDDGISCSSSSAGIPKSNSNHSSQQQQQHATTTTTKKKKLLTSWEDDTDHVTFQEIERIHVNDPTAAERVTNARMLGIPVCLVGHKGWANFAKRWLKKSSTSTTATPGDTCSNSSSSNDEVDIDDVDDDDDDDDGPLDLALPHEIDVEKMIADIGNQDVPVLQHAYNEQNPIRKTIKASEFLQEHWNKKQPSRKRLYLHQWQFPQSDNNSSSLATNNNNIISTKLCGDDNNHALDNNILGIDLLKFWLDEPFNDNPFQYLFMGGAKTRSKMHKDDGGLLITIAPIAGIKEVVLAHRSDAATCLYHLEADVNQVDLQKYPLASWSKLWKSEIVPGEILVMPEGTYHQCRNVTPCLSYSRFHLDHVNLRAFFESYINMDAPELQHDEIIWNAMSALRDRIQQHIHQVRTKTGTGAVATTNQQPATPAPPPDDMERAAFTLKKLNLIAREFANRFQGEMNTKECSDWSDMVHNVDLTLHRFQHRHATRIPTFQTKKSATVTVGHEQKTRPLLGHFSFSQKLQSALEKTPVVPPYDLGMVVPDDIRLQENDLVVVHLLERRAIGTILEIKSTMKAAFVRYEQPGIIASTTYSSSPCIEDEYIPFGKLKVPIAGESGAPFCPQHIKKDMLVICHEKNGEEYRAFIQYWKTATFYRIRIDLDGGKCIVTRWLTRDSIAQKLTATTHAAAAAAAPEKDDDDDMPDDDDDASMTTGPQPAQGDDKPEYYEVEEAQRPATCRASSATTRLDCKPEYFKVVEKANKSWPEVTAAIAKTHLPVVDTKPKYCKVEVRKRRRSARVAFASTPRLPSDTMPEYSGVEKAYRPLCVVGDDYRRDEV